MPGGAGLIVVLLACLQPESASAPAAVEPPIVASAEVFGTEGGVLAYGKVHGVCAGVVYVELVGADGRAQARDAAASGAWQTEPLGEAPARLRWGCDPDGDGRVESPDVGSAPVGVVPLTGGVLVLPP